MVLLVGAWGYHKGWVTLGQITAAVLYVQALGGPLDRLIRKLDRLQVGAASTSRLLGIAQVPPDRVAGDRVPDGPKLTGEDLRFAYREGHDVLHGVDLDLRPGERLAIVGPSGSGKSTLGRLLSGINGPRTGSVTVGGVELTTLPLEVLRTEVALVTQEHHVFVGSVRDNVILAREDSSDDAVWDALRDGGRLETGSSASRRAGHHDRLGQHQLTPAQAQQIALARLVVADPHTLVLDEATSLIDPRTARTSRARWPRCSRAAPSWPSPTGCTPPTTPTGSPSSSTAGSPSSAATTSWSRTAASTPRCGGPGPLASAAGRGG